MPAMDYSKVADLYDLYAQIEVDISFFLQEAQGCNSILELTSGTGRLSLPLIRAHVPLTCLDYEQAIGERMKPTNKSLNSIDDYIAGFPSDVQSLLKQVRATIKKAAPDATEAIKYRLATFILNENLVHFGAFKNHIGFYPTASGIEAFKDNLSPYKSSKGAVQFPIDKPMPLSLIAKIVKFRVKDVQAKLTARKRNR
jgi:uncharacterized protein YdhG (YjbR/CyaY superfamily)